MVFVDLVKVFDTIHHKILFKLLKKYGIPIYLIKVIEKLYKDFKIEIKVGKKKELINYSIGVKQGDNLAPILFIIFMQFMVELVQKKWKDNNISTLKFQHNKNKFYQGGKLIRNKTNKVPVTLDEGALMFSSRKDAILGSNVIFE